MTPSRRPRLEALEDRTTPTAATPWLAPGSLTLSFVPDGTPVGNSVSALIQTLDATAPGGVWRAEVLRAFQSWAVHGNVNIGLVADGGQPLGATGAVQGDARFGDIRIAGRPLGGSVVATANGFSLAGGTWSGDVVLNTSLPLGIGGSTGYDLFSVMLHEAGHVFGLEHSDEIHAALSARYAGVRAGPTADEIADFQSLYGVRQPDRFEGPRGNDEARRAAALGAFAEPIRADVTTLSDVDWYKFSVPDAVAAGSTIDVTLSTSGVSLLTPSLAVFDAALNPLGTAAASGPLGGELTLALANVNPGSVYYIKVGNATQSVFGIGAYQLDLSDSHASSRRSPPEVLANAENHRNDSFTSADWLAAGEESDLTLDYAFQASISIPADVDYYRVRSPRTAGAELIVLVSAGESTGLLPQVEVFDDSFAPVASEVIGNDHGYFSVRVGGYQPGEVYYFRVSAQNPAGAESVGNYLIGIHFNAEVTVEAQSFVAGILTAAEPQQAQALALAQTAAFQFVLAADGAAGASVQMTIHDQWGNLVFSLTATAGQPAVTGVAYLAAGTYTVRYRTLTPSGLPLSYTLQGWLISDPIGPSLLDSTTSGTDQSVPPPPYPIYSWSDPSYLALDPWPALDPSLVY